MSVRKKPERAVQALLDRLSKDKEQILQVLADNEDDTRKMISMLKDIESTLNRTASSVSRTKSWERQVMEQFCKLEQVLHDDIFTLKDPVLLSQVLQKLDMADLNKLISTVDVTVLPQNNQAPEVPDHESRVDEDEIVSHEHEDAIKEIHLPEDDPKLINCLSCLLVFPENTPIKKRPLIYWWMGEGLVDDEKAGEQVFQQLHNKGFIRPTATNSLTLCPRVRRVLRAQEDKQRIFLKDAMDAGKVLTVFNMNEQYLPIGADWLRKLQNLKVLQLGRWQDSPTYHIEAEKYEHLLSGLGSPEELKYLSLRGISGIETLPPTIGKLVGLHILDLRACHNLEKLPDTISYLRELTHLDVSECYLLESIPKRLQHLTKLQVLKGFVVDSTRKGSCKIDDLVRLTKMRKLSIRVRSGVQLESLVNLSALRILTISWMEEKMEETAANAAVELPRGLTKLDLWSVPFKDMPQWLQPRKLPDLENLRIKGGRLNLPMNQNPEYPNVKFVRLQYLTDLAIDQKNLVTIFPNYLYLEKTNCDLHPNIILSRSSVPHK